MIVNRRNAKRAICAHISITLFYSPPPVGNVTPVNVAQLRFVSVLNRESMMPVIKSRFRWAPNGRVYRRWYAPSRVRRDTVWKRISHCAKDRHGKILGIMTLGVQLTICVQSQPYHLTASEPWNLWNSRARKLDNNRYVVGLPWKRDKVFITR